MALSTGWLPPVPRPSPAQNVAMATKLGLPAPIKPDIEEMRRVMLKAGRRPIKSAVMGQKLDPMTRPAYLATLRKAMRLTANSVRTGGVMMVMACSQSCDGLSDHR